MKKTITILAVAFMIAAGCDKMGDDIKEAPEDFVEISQEHLPAGPDGQSFEVTVNSSGDWRINGGAGWVTPSASEGKNGDKVTFTVDPNKGEETLETTFKIFAGSAVREISVISSPVWYLKAGSDEESATFGNDGGWLEFFLDTNVPADRLMVEYSSDGEEWISCENTIKGMKFTKMQFYVSPSELYKERESDVTIKGMDELSLQIHMHQDMNVGFFVDTESVSTDNTAQEIEFIVRTNTGFELNSYESWISGFDQGDGELMEDGLTKYTCKASLTETMFSRKGEITVTQRNPYRQEKIPVSQVNPNPLTAKISDPKFAEWLIGQGWINESLDGSDNYELLEKGTTVTKLSIGTSYGSTIVDIDEISGLSAFPKLKEIEIQKCSVKRLDITGAKIEEYKFNIGECHELEYVNMGEYTSGFKFASWSVGDDTKQWQSSETFTLINPVPTYIDLSCEEKSMKDKENLKVIDVTGCTNLNLLYADRSCDDFCVLETIYVTEQQMAEYQRYLETGEGFNIDKNDKTEVVVKP